MRELETRIAALEVSTIGASLPVLNEAYGRIFSGLRSVLLESVSTSDLQTCEADHKPAANATGATFEELLCGIWERMQTGAMSDNDWRVLAAMPIDDLDTVGMSAAGVINVFKRMFDDY